MTDRDLFLGILPNLPRLAADAIAVFCGEDGEARLERATQLFQMGAADTVHLLGGRDEPPAIMGAERAFPVLMGMGVAPDRITFENVSQHTGEQATALVAHAQANGWGRVMLVASAYHLPRAFLTCVQAIRNAGADDTLQIVPVAVSHTPWFAAPDGLTTTRAERYAEELAKIDAYQGRGCASYAEGLAYLRRWEGK